MDVFPKSFFSVVGFLCPLGPGPMCLSCVFSVFRPFEFSDFYCLRVSVPVFPFFGFVLGVGLVVCVWVICLVVVVGEIRLPRCPRKRLRRTQPATDGGEGSVKVLVFRDSGWFARGARARWALRAST